MGQVGEGVAVATFDGTITYVNDAWAHMHEYEPEELIGANLSLFHTERQMIDDVGPFNEVVHDTGRFQGEVGHVTRSGREFPTLMTTTVIRDDQGHPMEMVAVARDISNRRQMLQTLETRGKYLGCLAEISTLMIETVDVLVFLPEVLQLLGETAGVSRTYLFVNETIDDGELTCSRMCSWQRETAPRQPEDDAVHQRMPYQANGLGRWVEVLSVGNIIASSIEEMPKPERDRLLQFHIKSLLLIPLFVSGDWYGYIGFDCCKRARLWTDQEIALLKVAAAQIASGIENHRLLEAVILDARKLENSNQELKKAYEETLEGWARALELRDNETEGHSRRVADIALKIGSRLGLNEDQLVHLHRGALLHDIGKMAVPDHILRKPGPLDDDEWAIIRDHPVYAHQMLAPINYLSPALAIPCSHHERMDGSGYPEGLKGEDIPLPARIFAVVDVWDAVTSDRTYRDAWSNERALDYLREHSGTLFDSSVVDAFLQLYKDDT